MLAFTRTDGLRPSHTLISLNGFISLMCSRHLLYLRNMATIPNPKRSKVTSSILGEICPFNLTPHKTLSHQQRQIHIYQIYPQKIDLVMLEEIGEQTSKVFLNPWG